MKQFVNQRGMILTLLIFGLTIGANLQAQEREPHRPPMPADSVHVEKMIDDMAKELSLSKEQRAKIKELSLAHFNEVNHAMEKDRTRHEQHREKMEEMRTKFEDQIASVLTKDQQEGCEQFRESHRPKHGMKTGGKH